jgi:hypothetical protein
MKWITCNYHGTEDKGNHPVNLELIVNFYKYERRPGTIMFVHSKDHGVLWEFENDATRDLEYQRLVETYANQ